MKRAFTLAEIMIVLVVIGILAAIMLPSAIKSSPKEDIMKFKKTNVVLLNMIKDFTSGNNQYYFREDLGKKKDGTLVTSPTYFCETLADVLTVKKSSCQSTGYATETYVSMTEGLDTVKAKLDSICASAKESIEGGYEIEGTDGVQWYQASPQVAFGTKDAAGNRIFSDPTLPPNYPDGRGFDANYKVLCIDVDGNKDDPPMGYGIRADGKVILGALADEWLDKSLTEKKGD